MLYVNEQRYISEPPAHLLIVPLPRTEEGRLIELIKLENEAVLKILLPHCLFLT